MIRTLLAALVLVALLAPPTPGAERVARVAVFSSGAVQLDGRPTTLPALDEELRKLKVAGGVVWYDRENPASEPPSQGSAVIQMIIKHQLPVSMSTRPDFSDYVDDKGVSRPRPRQSN